MGPVNQLRVDNARHSRDPKLTRRHSWTQSQYRRQMARHLLVAEDREASVELYREGTI